jgi:acetolactate synthase I/II/III large subunit
MNKMFISRFKNNISLIKYKYFSADRYFTSGADILHQSLLKNKINTVFGYSGGAILPVLDKFYESPIQFIMNRTEQCAGHAATGYAKSSGKLGVIVSTSGPGVTNLITPLQDAYTDGVPILSLTGQVPTNVIGTDAFQECPATALTKPCTKWSYQIKSDDDIQEVIDYSINLAESGRKGPVHIDLPKDIMSLEYNHNTKVKANYKIENLKPDINNQLINLEKVVSLIENAKKPVIIAGNGCLDSYQELRKFVEKSKIPITTTLHGMGTYDERKKLSLHMLGMHGSAYANYAVQNADLLLGIGCRFDDRITGNLKGYAPNAFRNGGVIHIDNNMNQINKVKDIIKPNISIHSETKDFLDYINKSISKRKDTERKDWFSQIDQWKNDYPFCYKPSKSGIPKTQEVIKKLYQYVNSNNLNENTIITTGVGNHQMMSAQFFRWINPRSILTSGSAGVMGAGLPFAIGAQIANPNKNIVLIDGDSSFNMTFNDLGTVYEKQLPIKIMIFNDGRQQMVHVWQNLFFNKRFIATNNVNPSYTKLAESFGIESFLCDKSTDINAAIELMYQTNKPILVEFIIEPDFCLPLVAPGKNLDEMITDYDTLSKGKKMEGLAPS